MWESLVRFCFTFILRIFCCNVYSSIKIMLRASLYSKIMFIIFLFSCKVNEFNREMKNIVFFVYYLSAKLIMTIFYLNMFLRMYKSFVSFYV